MYDISKKGYKPTNIYIYIYIYIYLYIVMCIYIYGNHNITATGFEFTNTLVHKRIPLHSLNFRYRTCFEQGVS